MPLSWTLSRYARAVVWITTAALILVTTPYAQEKKTAAVPEPAVKAALVIKILQYLDWSRAPQEAQPADVLIIAVVDADAVANALKQLAAGDHGLDRRVEVRTYTRVEDISDCHVLYLGGTAEDGFAAMQQKTNHKAVLTITEHEGYAERGAAINFLREGDRITFEVNHDTLQAAALHLDPRVLRVAKRVYRSTGAEPKDQR